MSNIIVIYHGACDDGFASAYVARKFFLEEAQEDTMITRNITYYPGVYQKDPPDVTGLDVYLVDFSYKRPVLENMLEQCSQMTIIDHHKTAREDLENIQHPKLWTMFDMSKCGAMLCWEYFFSGEEPPEFIKYINDRDMWLKQLPMTDEFTIALRSYPQDFKVWDSFFDRPNLLTADGIAIQRYYRQQVEAIKKNAYRAIIGGRLVYIANAPYAFASEVAGELAEYPGAEFGASYFEVSPNYFQYSLRSRTDFDVSEIAKHFGGGGHKAAAGFSTCGFAHANHPSF